MTCWMGASPAGSLEARRVQDPNQTEPIHDPSSTDCEEAPTGKLCSLVRLRRNSISRVCRHLRSTFACEYNPHDTWHQSKDGEGETDDSDRPAENTHPRGDTHAMRLQHQKTRFLPESMSAWAKAQSSTWPNSRQGSFAVSQHSGKRSRREIGSQASRSHREITAEG